MSFILYCCFQVAGQTRNRFQYSQFAGYLPCGTGICVLGKKMALM